MARQRVIQFEYLQSLLQDSDKPGWSETVSVSVRILSEALTSGWYRERFASRGNDFVILLAIAMHARPLRDPDLAQLIKLGMATAEDQNRLYARVSDIALAAELGMNRVTIARATERLEKEQSISIVEIPEEIMAFRDSHGRFNGSKVYLLAGDLQSRFFEKDIQPTNRATKSSTVEDLLQHRVTKSSMVEDAAQHRVIKSNTVDGESAPHRATKSSTVSPHRATLLNTSDSDSRINKDDDESDEEVNGGAGQPTLAEQALAYFTERMYASRKGVFDYQPSAKEQRAAELLTEDGFTLEQIQAGIDAAFSRNPLPRHFTHCAAITRDLARQLPEDSQPEARTPETDQETARSKPEESPIHPDLARAYQIYTSTGRNLSEDVLVRLQLMAESCEKAAQAQQSNGGSWLADALTLALGKAKPENLLSYADRVIDGWVRDGREKRARQKAEDAPALTAELAIFEQVTGRLPLRDQRDLVIRLIRQNQYTAEYLRLFWHAWVGRDKKRTDLGWLDWAARGSIPESSSARSTGLDASLDTLFQYTQKYSGEMNGNP